MCDTVPTAQDDYAHDLPSVAAGCSVTAEAEMLLHDAWCLYKANMYWERYASIWKLLESRWPLVECGTVIEVQYSRYRSEIKVWNRRIWLPSIGWQMCKSFVSAFVCYLFVYLSQHQLLITLLYGYYCSSHLPSMIMIWCYCSDCYLRY